MPLPTALSTPARIATIALFALSFGAATSAMAQEFDSSAGKLRAETVVSGISHPWGMTKLPDGSFLITERAGRLWHVADGQKQEVAGVPQVAAVGQGGLLDIEADENFAENRRIYFTWSEPGDGGYSTALSTATVAPDYTHLDSIEKLFAMQRKTNSGHHFGSRVVLAPDGKLFMTMGDRGEGDRSQDMQDHAGSIVRLNRDGSVPADNPFVVGGGLGEMWSVGHRNPQGAAWDTERGFLWEVEHGARGGDEINRPQAGLNYGWPVISYGVHYSGGKIGVGQRAEGYEQPLWYWDPSIAPSGLDVYYGDLFPQWQGDLLVGALKFQLLVRLDVENGQIVDEERLFEGEFGRIRDVQVYGGEIYLLTDEPDGQLVRIMPAD